MASRMVIDKTVYFLMGSLLVGMLLLAGCSKEESQTVEVEIIESEVVETTEVETTEVEPEEVSDEADVSPIDSDDNSSVDALSYVDGVYTQSGSYQNPPGEDSVSVTLTIEEDVVTAVSVSANSDDETSLKYQKLFMEGVESVVVGKPLNELAPLGPVNGSSLTPKGFNQALELIKSEAAA